MLIVPKDNPAGIRSVYSLKDGPAKRLSIGAAGVPVGGYTRQLLARLRLGRVLTQNVVSNEQNVAGVVSKVALGSAVAGFVYVTDGKIASDRVRVIRLPTWAQPPIRYEFCEDDAVDHGPADGGEGDPPEGLPAGGAERVGGLLLLVADLAQRGDDFTGDERQRDEDRGEHHGREREQDLDPVTREPVARASLHARRGGRARGRRRRGRGRAASR